MNFVYRGMATRLHLFILLGVLLGHAQGQSCENTRVVFQGVQNVKASSNVILPSLTAIGTFIVASQVSENCIHSVDIHALE